MTSPLFYREVKEVKAGRVYACPHWMAWFEYVGAAEPLGDRHNIDDMVHQTGGGDDCVTAYRPFRCKAAAEAWLDHWEAQFAKMTPMDGDGWTADEIQDARQAKADEESACRFEASAATQRAEEQACRDTDNRI